MGKFIASLYCAGDVSVRLDILEVRGEDSKESSIPTQSVKTVPSCGVYPGGERHTWCFAFSGEGIVLALNPIREIRIEITPVHISSITETFLDRAVAPPPRSSGNKTPAATRSLNGLRAL